MFRRQVLQHAARPLRQQLSAQQAQQLGSAAAACGSSIQQSSGGAVGDGGGSSWTTITARRLLATLSSSTSSSSSSSAAAAAAAACQQPWRQWAGAHARRQLFSSAEGGQGGGGSGGGAARKSMLDASLPHSAAMEGVAATRLRAAAAAGGDAGGAGSAGAGAGARGPFRRVLSWLFDAAIIASLAAVLGGGVAYASYSVGEVQELLAQATQAQEAQGEASLPQAAWVKLLQLYLAVAEPLDAKVHEYTDPTCDALLPELAPELRGRVKTLVLDLEELLVHKEWSRARGWQVMKRPGVEAFLLEMGKRYETVIFTDEPAMYADPIINRIDPHRAVTYRLYRQETQYHNGKHVRDLSKLNRDMSQVLFISANPSAYAFQPENTLKLSAWDHNPQDTTLFDLIPFLQMVQEVAVNDVRDVVRSYDGEEDVAAAFKARMARMEKQKGGGGRLSRMRG